VYLRANQYSKKNSRKKPHGGLRAAAGNGTEEKKP
jgi:hypothetical protein